MDEPRMNSEIFKEMISELVIKALSTSKGRHQHMLLPPLCHLSNIKGFHREDVNAARLKVVPQVVGRDHQQHLTGVAFLSVELDKHVGV